MGKRGGLDGAPARSGTPCMSPAGGSEARGRWTGLLWDGDRRHPCQRPHHHKDARRFDSNTSRRQAQHTRNKGSSPRNGPAFGVAGSRQILKGINCPAFTAEAE
jgi:hypothetical protein